MDCTIALYLESKTTLIERVNAIEVLIDKMLIKMAESLDADKLSVDEYWLDDGQMKVKTSYRSIEDINTSIATLEKIKQTYLNRLNGRGFVLRDVRGLGH